MVVKKKKKRKKKEKKKRGQKIRTQNRNLQRGASADEYLGWTWPSPKQLYPAIRPGFTPSTTSQNGKKTHKP